MLRPLSGKRYARILLAVCDSLLCRVCRKNGFLASVYYCLFSDTFRREHRCVLEGRHQFLKKKKDGYTNIYQLRRNIHRLEKGIIAKPQKGIFALEYIEETLGEFERHMLQQRSVDLKTLKWSKQVLDEYFAIAWEHSAFQHAKQRYYDLLARVAFEDAPESYTPFQREALKAPPVSYDDLLALASHRKSVRGFLDIPVPGEALEKAISLAMLSPTACNRMPYRFIVAKHPADARRLGALPMGTTSFVHNIQTIVAIVGDLSAYEFERDRHLIYIDAALAAMAFCFAMESQGLSTCCINWPDIESREQAMAQFLKLPAYERVVMLVAVGYEDNTSKVAFSAKKDLHHVMTYYAG